MGILDHLLQERWSDDGVAAAGAAGNAFAAAGAAGAAAGSADGSRGGARGGWRWGAPRALTTRWRDGGVGSDEESPRSVADGGSGGRRGGLLHFQLGRKSGSGGDARADGDDARPLHRHTIGHPAEAAGAVRGGLKGGAPKRTHVRFGPETILANKKQKPANGLVRGDSFKSRSAVSTIVLSEGANQGTSQALTRSSVGALGRSSGGWDTDEGDSGVDLDRTSRGATSGAMRQDIHYFSSPRGHAKSDGEEMGSNGRDRLNGAAARAARRNRWERLLTNGAGVRTGYSSPGCQPSPTVQGAYGYGYGYAGSRRVDGSGPHGPSRARMANHLKLDAMESLADVLLATTGGPRNQARASRGGWAGRGGAIGRTSNGRAAAALDARACDDEEEDSNWVDPQQPTQLTPAQMERVLTWQAAAQDAIERYGPPSPPSRLPSFSVERSNDSSVPVVPYHVVPAQPPAPLQNASGTPPRGADPRVGGAQPAKGRAAMLLQEYQDFATPDFRSPPSVEVFPPPAPAALQAARVACPAAHQHSTGYSDEPAVASTTGRKMPSPLQLPSSQSRRAFTSEEDPQQGAPGASSGNGSFSTDPLHSANMHSAHLPNSCAAAASRAQVVLSGSGHAQQHSHGVHVPRRGTSTNGGMLQDVLTRRPWLSPRVRPTTDAGAASPGPADPVVRPPSRGSGTPSPPSPAMPGLPMDPLPAADSSDEVAVITPGPDYGASNEPGVSGWRREGGSLDIKGGSDSAPHSGAGYTSFAAVPRWSSLKQGMSPGPPGPGFSPPMRHSAAGGVSSPAAPAPSRMAWNPSGLRRLQLNYQHPQQQPQQGQPPQATALRSPQQLLLSPHEDGDTSTPVPFGFDYSELNRIPSVASPAAAATAAAASAARGAKPGSVWREVVRTAHRASKPRPVSEATEHGSTGEGGQRDSSRDGRSNG